MANGRAEYAANFLWFCLHKWEDIGDYDYHKPGAYAGLKAKMWHDEMISIIDRNANGWTIFHQRCKVCGRVETKEVIGKFSGAK